MEKEKIDAFEKLVTEFIAQLRRECDEERRNATPIIDRIHGEVSARTYNVVFNWIRDNGQPNDMTCKEFAESCPKKTFRTLKNAGVKTIDELQAIFENEQIIW